MAEQQRRFARRWPVAVLAAAAVAAVSLGDVMAGWYSYAGRGPSATGEYPLRIVLRQARPAGGANAVAVPATGAESEEAAGEPAAPDGEPSPAAADAGPGARTAETPSSAPRPATDGLLAIQFDLADPGAFAAGGGSPIEIRKAVRLNGADAGEARIHVGASSRLSIAREELGRLLARSGQQALIERLGTGERLVSFDEMRRQGIDVRYDPVSDRLLVYT
jgi:hypothetical protein